MFLHGIHGNIGLNYIFSLHDDLIVSVEILSLLAYQLCSFELVICVLNRSNAASYFVLLLVFNYL